MQCSRDGIPALQSRKALWLNELVSYDREMSSHKKLNLKNHNNFIQNSTILKWLYENPLESRGTFFIKEIRNIFIKNGIKCPYCGISPCKTLDHYYCKSSLPQFSILHNNLIPCCGDCNKEKGTLKVKKTWKRLINPFYDNYEDTLGAPIIFIIFKRISPTSSAIDYAIIPNQNLSRKEKMHVNFHISRMKIKTSHSEFILDSFDRFSSIIKGYNEKYQNNKIDRETYQSLISTILSKNPAKSYDWDYIVIYSLINIQQNSWAV